MKKIVVFILIILVVLGGIYFVFKNKQNKLSLKDKNQNSSIVRQNDPPFMLNFPVGLIPDKGIVNVVDSFRVESKGSAVEQFTYKYVTNDPFSSIHPYFDKYFIKNGFTQGFLNSKENVFSLSARKEKVSVSVYAEKNIDGSGTTVEINVVK